MDEMMNMNEITMENETSVEVVPEENVQMIDNEETSSNGSGIGPAVGAVGLGCSRGIRTVPEAQGQEAEQGRGEAEDQEEDRLAEALEDRECRFCTGGRS